MVLVSLLVLSSACSVTFDSGTLGVAATVSEPAGAPAQGTPFRVTQKAVFLILGTIPANRPSLERALASQMLDADSVADLKIHVGSRFTDILISALTVGLIIPRSVTYEGVIINRNP
jgi:hypothetical protein